MADLQRDFGLAVINDLLALGDLLGILVDGDFLEDVSWDDFLCLVGDCALVSFLDQNEQTSFWFIMVFR